MSSVFINIVFITFSPRVVDTEVNFIFIYDTLILTILHLHYCSLAGEELTTTVKWRQFVKTAMLQAGA